MIKVSKPTQTVRRPPALSVRLITLALTLIVGVTGTSASASEAAEQTGTATQQTQDSTQNRVSPVESSNIADQYAVADIKFAPCAENPELECGTLTVPVDYREPRGEKVDLAVIRAKATSPYKRIGVFFATLGGPSSGINLVLGGIRSGSPFVAKLREYFDIVSFDPRGVGRSRPFRCQIEPAKTPTDLDDAALAQFFDDFSRRIAQACLEQNGSAFATSLSTNNVARDVDVLRRALGERQITFGSLNYGTKLGAVYASLFPQRVRAMVLDAGIAPEHRDNLTELASEQTFSYELAFQRLDQMCQDDPACRLRETGVTPAFDTVAARLKAEPVTSPEGAVLTSVGLSDVVATFLTSERSWPLIVDALADAHAGDYKLLFQLLPSASIIPLLDAPSVHPIYAYLANDYGTRRPAAEYLTIDEAVGKLSPRFFGRFQVASHLVATAAWPKADPPIIRNVKNHVANPILLIGNDFDPNNPLAWTRRLARALGMEQSLIRYQGGGTGAYAIPGIPCIDDAVYKYLFYLNTPAEGFSCPGRPVSFGPPAAPADAEGKRTMDNITRDSPQQQQPARIR